VGQIIAWRGKQIAKMDANAGGSWATCGVAPQQSKAEGCARNFQKAYTFLTCFT
jgi:hypothetical protein